MKKIFLDTNILADLVGERTQYDSGVEQLIDAEYFPIICISALSVPVVLYVFKIKMDSEEFLRFSEIISTMNILPLTSKIIIDATKHISPDYEDSLQYLTAIENNCDYILTRDKKDFEKIKKVIPSKIKIVTNISQIK